MQQTNFKRTLSFLTAVSMVLSMVILPAAAEEESDHTHDYTQETIVAEATCGVAGSKKLSCTCGDFIEEGIPATGEHNYDQGVCTVCEAEKPCNGTADCDAPTHTSCLSQCDLHTSCPSDVHKEGCLKDAPCTCIQACSENLVCPVCQDNGTCTGSIAAENISRVQALIDALPASYNLSQEAQMKAQYDACTAEINGLQEYERAALNLTKYTAAATPTIIDDVNVAFIGQTGYPTLAEAIAASQENSVISLKAGTHTLPAALTKDVKIQALDGVQAKDIIIDLGTTSSTAENMDVSFTGMTLVRPADSAAQGFQGAASETYTNCIIQGQYWAFAKNAVFSGCTFETTDAANYNIHTHRAETVSFTNCTFNCAGKSVKIYNEGTNGTNATFSGCTFKSSSEAEGNAAIEIDSSLLASLAKYRIFTVSISSCRASTVSGQGSFSLWKNTGKLTEISVNGAKIVSIKPTAETLPVLVNVKDSIVLENDVTLSETLVISKPVTLNLNGKTITNDVASGSLFHANNSLTISGTASGSSIKSSENSAGILLTNEGSANLSSGSFDGKVISNGENAVVSISGGTYSNFAAEMTDGGLIVIGGGTFKTGDTVTDVSAYTVPGYAQNSETGTVSQQDVPSTGSKAGSNVQINSSLVNETVESITANTAPESADTGLNALFSQTNLNSDLLTVLKANPENAGKTYYGTTLRTTVKVTLEKLYIDGDQVTGLDFTAEPQVQAINKDGTVFASAPISIEDTNTKVFTFRIPIVGTSAGKLVNLTHDSKNMGTYPVQGTGDNLYIEIKTSSFSPWSVTILAEDAKNVARVGSVNFADIDSALSYLQENGGNLELLENVTTAAVLTLPAEKTAEIALSGKTYTYTGTAAAFVNNGTNLVLGGGTVSATAGGTLAQSSAGTLEISGITFTSTTASGETTTPSTTGNTIAITGGTATIKSGSFSGNAASLSVTSGSATVTGGTFNEAVSGTMTIKNGTFNKAVNGAATIQGGTYNASVTTTVPINAVVDNAENPARFATAPADTMIVENCSAVKIGDYYVIRRNPHILVKKGSAAETPIYYKTGEDFDDILAAHAPATFTLTRDEVVGSNHTLSGDRETIIEFAGNKITGTGSLIAGSKSLFMKGMGNGLVDVELGTGDKATFTSNGTISITAAENKSASTSYGYGEVKLSLKVDDKTVSSVYFLGTDATLKVGANGAISTTGQVITQLSADENGKPTYLINSVSDGTDLTNNFVMKSSDKLVFTSNGFYEGFSKVTVNGKDLSTSNYTKEKGSTIITLKNTYLKTLTKGKYELKIHYKDGKTAAANFYVVEAAKATTTPKTGDPIMTAVFGMNASAAALGAMLFLGKKKKK